MSYTHCAVCSKKLPNPTDKYHNYCQESCLDDYCYIYGDNFLVTKYNTNHLIFELLVNTAVLCLNSNNAEMRYNPKPKYINFKNIKSIIPMDFVINIHTYFKEFITDSDIMKKFGRDFYYYLKFTIITNNTNLIPSKIIQNKNVMLDKEPLNIYEHNIQFDVGYSPDKEKDYKDIPLYYLFHGSSSSNWYGILRNGLKNCSGTALMTTGQAYGPGIYLSDSLQFAKNYSGIYAKHNQGSDKITIVGVCQVKKPIATYNKAPNIFTIQDDTELILRHIIVNPDAEHMKSIESYFKTVLPSQHSYFQKNIYNINNKRLIKEMEFIEKSKEKFLKNEYIKNISIDSKLEPYLQLNVTVETEDKNIKINFIFRNFPVNPPIVFLENCAIKSANFYNDTIYLESDLYPKNWVIKNKISDYLGKIINIINKDNIKITSSNDINKMIKLYDEYINKNNLYVN
jgi:hypothetical protein